MRGEAPLQPEKAKAAGYPENNSPLARLHKGYRRNAAGRRCLVPGDGNRPLHEETRQWARKFWAGDPDYQADEKWWAQVLIHEERVEAAKLAKATGDSKDQADEDAVIAALGGEGSTSAEEPSTTEEPTPEPEPGAPAKPETVQERLARYVGSSEIMPELSRTFGLPDLGQLQVETRTLHEHIADADNHPTPIWLALGPGGTATALIDLTHEAFTKLGLEPAELVVAEVSAALKVKADSHLAHSQIAARLRATCLPDTAVDPAVIRAQAAELLDPDEQTQTENALIADGGDTLTASLVGSGRFLLYAPPLYLVKLLENWPEPFMEGNVFAGPYTSLTSPSSRRLSLARVVGYLNDVATLLTFQASPSVSQLRRTRLSLQLLQQELAPEEQ